MFANEATDTNANRTQPFSRNLVEQKRRGRTLPAVINGITASEAQAQGLVAEDYSDNDGSASANDESLFLPDGRPAIAETGKQPNANETSLLTPAIPWRSSEALSDTDKFSRPSMTPFQIFDIPKIDTSTSPFFGKPSMTTSSQPAAPQFSSPQSNLQSTVVSPFNNLYRSDPAASPSGSLNKAAFTPELDLVKPFNSQAQPDLSLTVPSVSETSKSTSIAQPPKFGFGASSPPSLTVTPSRFSTQETDTHVNFSAKVSPNTVKAKAGEPKPSSLASIAMDHYRTGDQMIIL